MHARLLGILIQHGLDQSDAARREPSRLSRSGARSSRGRVWRTGISPRSARWPSSGSDRPWAVDGRLALGIEAPRQSDGTQLRNRHGSCRGVHANRASARRKRWAFRDIVVLADRHRPRPTFVGAPRGVGRDASEVGLRSAPRYAQGAAVAEGGMSRESLDDSRHGPPCESRDDHAWCASGPRPIVGSARTGSLTRARAGLSSSAASAEGAVVPERRPTAYPWTIRATAVILGPVSGAKENAPFTGE